MSSDNKRWYTPDEAAKYCEVSKWMILEARKKGDLKSSPLNKHVIRFTKEQLDEWTGGDGFDNA